MKVVVVTGIKYGALAGLINFEIYALLLVFMLSMPRLGVMYGRITRMPIVPTPTFVPLQSQQESTYPISRDALPRQELAMPTQDQSQQRSPSQAQLPILPSLRIQLTPTLTPLPTVQAPQSQWAWPPAPITKPFNTFLTLPQSAVVYAIILGAFLGCVGGSIFYLLPWCRLSFFSFLANLFFSYLFYYMALTTIEIMENFFLDDFFACSGPLGLLLRLIPGAWITYKLVWWNLLRLQPLGSSEQLPSPQAGGGTLP